MGSVVRFSRHRARARFAPPPRRAGRSYLPALLLLAGVCVIAASVGSKTVAPPSAPSATRATLSEIRVIDGDSLRAGADNIRLLGIDAPERGQTCRDARNREWSCGLAATTRLRELVARGDVACAPQGRDRYGRTLAVCSAGDVADLGQALVREGYAVTYSLDTVRYSAEENAARAAGRGIWQGAFEHPRDWRRRHPRSG